MFRKRIFLLLLLLFLFSNHVKAQGEASALFLLIDPSARANGMAGAFSAIANDATAMYYNPAGLTQMKFCSLDIFNYADWLPGLSILDYEFLFSAGTFKVPSVGSFGISFKRIDWGNNPQAVTQGNFRDGVNSYESALALGYARSMNSHLSIGGSIKLIRSKLPPVIYVNGEGGLRTSTAFAFDIGFLLQNLFSDFCYSKNFTDYQITKWAMHRPPPGPAIGISISNIGPKIKYRDDKNHPLPQNLRLGFSWNLIDTDLIGYLFSMDVQKLLVRINSDGSSDAFYKAIFTSWDENGLKDMTLSIGQEMTIIALFSIRVGRFMEHEDFGARKFWTLGFSIGPETARFNISFYYPDEKNHPLEGTKFFGLSIAY